jgi:hypothetical protein
MSSIPDSIDGHDWGGSWSSLAAWILFIQNWTVERASQGFQK